MTWVRRLSALALVVFAACEQDRGAVEIRRGASTQEIQGGAFDGTSTNVVAILLMDGQNVGICSGSLIAPNLVLTAQHCVAPSNTTACSSGGFGATFAPGNFRITTSGTAAETTLSQGQWPNVNNTLWFGASVVSVPTSPANNICGGDMALIRLSSNITNICPLIPRVDSAVVANEAYTAVGFGITSPTGQTSGTRYTVSGLNVLCENNCGAGTNGTLEWVGGSTAQRGACEGDSGGPALDSLRRVLGTVSRGSANSCNQALYESVFGQAAWIKSVAAQAATAGGYAAAGWVNGGTTSINGCTGVDGGTGGGAGGGAGGGGGATGGGGGVTGGGGGSTGTCNAGTMCVDATGQGDFTCLSSGGAVPSGAPSCGPSTGCANGFTCWQTGTSTYACLQDCGGTPVGGGAGGGVTGGGAGGGGGSSGGACTNPSTTCVDASGQSNFACVDTNSSSGVPAGAPSCSQTMACPTNYGCWGSASGNFCLQNCTPGATGGGAGGGGGVPVGGGAGGGVPVGGGAGGGVPVGGGAGGGVPVGGGAGAGNAGTGGGFNFPGLPDKPKPTGCGCAGVPDGASVWLMLSGLTLLRRRRRH